MKTIKRKNLLAYYTLSIAALIAAVFVVYNCSDEKQVYTIGVSQCSDDEWRTKLNGELKMMSYINDSIDVVIKCANDNSQTQIQQIDSFINMGVDLLIVSPNQVSEVNPAVIKAYKSGTPIILYDRNISSNDYTAFVGSNNYKMGYDLGMYIANKLDGKGRVVEIMGLKDSSPSIGRSKGFEAAINKYPGIKIVEKAFGNWEQKSAELAMNKILSKTKDIDYVFAHNDRMAYGAYLSAKKYGKESSMKFVGIDGMSGKGRGIDLVCSGILDASYLNPTSGYEVIKLAMKILKGEKFSKYNNLATTIITHDNAELTRMSADNAERQRSILSSLHNQIIIYENHFETQTLFLWLLGLFLLSVIIASMFLYKNYQAKNKLSVQLAVKNDELERLNEEVINLTQSRMEFFTNISHELRTPLTLILDPLERVFEDKSLSKSTTALLKIVQRSAFTMKQLVNDIMDFRKIQSGKMKLRTSAFNLKASLLTWIDTFYPTAENKKVSLVLNTDAFSHANVVADEEKLNRIVFNLVSNAIKYTDAGGSIAVTLEDYGTDRLLLTVSDTGKGIAANDIGKVFDRFFQAENSNGGTGIGLAVVKAYAELHGGEAFVRSQLGKGSDFGIIIPCTQESLQNEDGEDTTQTESHTFITDNTIVPANHSKNSAATSKIISDEDKTTLLVVDDNKEICDYIQQTFGEEYTILEADNGKTGLEMALRYVPDIIVSDVMMPEMDGIEFCSKLRQSTAICHIPVILLTAKTLDNQIIEGYERGADSYMTKPFSSKVLRARIDNLLKNRRVLASVFGGAPVKVGDETPKDDILKAKADDIDKDFISRLRSVIQENLDNPDFGVESISGEIGLSRVQLYRKVKAITGVSVVDVLRKARLQRGKQLLIETDKTVSEIAYEVGFSSPSYFTKCFKDEYGLLPGEARG